MSSHGLENSHFCKLKVCWHALRSIISLQKNLDANRERVLSHSTHVRGFFDFSFAKRLNSSSGDPVNRGEPGCCAQCYQRKESDRIRAILQTIRPNGEIVPSEEATITVTITMTVAEFEKLKRASEVASHGGHVPSQKDVIVDAVETYLDKKDPLRIAERLERRRAAARQRPKDNRSDIWHASAAADP